MEASEPVKISRGVKLLQHAIGLLFWLTLVLPYARRVRGLDKIPSGRCLFVCNHVSLLDTLFLSGLLWRAGRLPMLVLGDKGAWNDSWTRRFLSGPFGYLLKRGKFNPRRLRELQTFGRAVKNFQLIVFPEGTRGNGADVAECQPGVFYVAQESRAPIVPVFIENMHRLSTKRGKVHPLGGWRKLEFHFGEAIAPENYLPLAREEFPEFIRQKIISAQRVGSD